MRQRIEYDSEETQDAARAYAFGGGQKAELDYKIWDVDADKSKMKQRLLAAGFIFEPIEILDDGSRFYKISRSRGAS